LAACGGGSNSGNTGLTSLTAETSIVANAKETAQALRDEGPVTSLVRTAELQDVSPTRSRVAASAAQAAQIQLGPLTAQKRASIEQRGKAAWSPAASAAVPTQVGLGRDVDATASEDATAQLLVWSDSPTKGRIAALHFSTPDAKGVRLGVRVSSLPLGATLRFYATGSPTLVEVSGQQVLASIQRNLDAGETGDAAHTYWSPDLGGEEVTLEIEVPTGTPIDQVQISVPRLTHVFERLDVSTITKSLGDAEACTLDVSCTHAYDAESKSVARMTFVKDGDGYACTGTLINDKVSSGTPYFLSAYHCVSTQAAASSITTDWFYRSSQCGSGILSDAARTLYGGATLLLASADTDTAFMVLSAAPPPGAVYSAWTAAPTAIGSDVFGLHHPYADLQKYSTGKVIDYFECIAHSPDGNCTFTSASTSSAHFIEVLWGQGPVQPGSSGSGVFATLNGTSVLIGQLFGGSASCTNALAVYGRFDIAYNAGISQWLNASAHGRIPIYRFFNTANLTHFYTASPAERDRVRRTMAQYNYEGIAFYAYADSSTGATGLERFFNSKTGAHFYTINPDEAATVRASNPTYSDEGKSWYANTGATDGSTAMYRFYNRLTETHFYTISSAERDMLLRTSSATYNYDGIAYYAWTGP
jgi:lysyl endopeptidase